MRRIKPGLRSLRWLLPLVGSGMVAIGVAAPAHAAVAAPAHAAVAANDTPISIYRTLGNAGPLSPCAPWAMITTSGDFTANGPGTDHGNVAVGAGSATLNNPFTIDGTVYLAPGVTYSSNATVTGGFVSSSTCASNAVSAAASAYSTFTGLAPTQSVGEIGNNSTISSTASNDFNVVDASDVNVTNGTITLSGNAGSVFIINVSGNFTLSNGGMVLSGGVLPGNVVWDVGGSLTITGGGPGLLYGFGLVQGTATVHDDTWTGELIADGITDTSGFTVISVPIGAIGGLVFAAAVGIVLMYLQRRRRKQRPQPSAG